MGRYRKIDSRIWNDGKFCALSERGKLVFFMLLTHPNMTALGAMRGTIEGLAAEMGWSAEAFREAFREALAKGMAEHNEKACLIALPKFIRYNPPESPNVVKAWAGALDLLPECQLKNKVIQRAKEYAEGMREGFAKALPEAFAKNMPYPEQEQEQEQEQEKDQKKGRAGAPKLPGWLPADVWVDWHNFRNSRKGWTAKARELSLRTLTELHAAGHDPRRVIDQSIERGWTGLFPIRDGAPAKPPMAQQFADKTYTGTPDDELPDFLRADAR